MGRANSLPSPASSYSVPMNTAKTVTVCVNFRANPDTPSCAAHGGTEIAETLSAAVAERGLAVTVETFHCLGMCDRGPNIKLSPGGEFWHAVQPGKLTDLLDRIAAFARE